MQTAEQQKHRSNNHDWAEGVAEGRGGNERRRKRKRKRREIYLFYYLWIISVRNISDFLVHFKVLKALSPRLESIILVKPRL